MAIVNSNNYLYLVIIVAGLDRFEIMKSPSRNFGLDNYCIRYSQNNVHRNKLRIWTMDDSSELSGIRENMHHTTDDYVST
jgi:hypothetical protein